jgi:hypothetical protein
MSAMKFAALDLALSLSLYKNPSSNALFIAFQCHRYNPAVVEETDS